MEIAPKKVKRRGACSSYICGPLDTRVIALRCAPKFQGAVNERELFFKVCMVKSSGMGQSICQTPAPPKQRYATKDPQIARSSQKSVLKWLNLGCTNPAFVPKTQN
eukprot:6463791-Amphidinium_carterae.1